MQGVWGMLRVEGRSEGGGACIAHFGIAQLKHGQLGQGSKGGGQRDTARITYGVAPKDEATELRRAGCGSRRDGLGGSIREPTASQLESS